MCKLSRLPANHVFSGCTSLTKFTSSAVKALLEDKTKNKKLDTLTTPAHSHSHTHSSTLCNIRAHAGSDKVFALKQYTARNSICLQMESPSRPRPGIEGLHPFAFSFRHEDTRGTDRTCVNLWPYCKPYICRNQCIGSRPQKTERKK